MPPPAPCRRKCCRRSWTRWCSPPAGTTKGSSCTILPSRGRCGIEGKLRRGNGFGLAGRETSVPPTTKCKPPLDELGCRCQRDHPRMGGSQAERHQPPALRQQPRRVHGGQKGPVLPVLPGPLQRGEDGLHEAGRDAERPAGLALFGAVPPHQLRTPGGRTARLPGVRSASPASRSLHPFAHHPGGPSEG